MATRTSPSKVKQIMESTDLTDPVIQGYIDTANDLITDQLGSSGLSDTRLENIEKWLTAHMIAVTQERTTVKEQVGEARVEYAAVFGEGLKASPYGQMVQTLDTTGAFASLGKKVASIKAITSFETT